MYVCIVVAPGHSAKSIKPAVNLAGGRFKLQVASYKLHVTPSRCHPVPSRADFDLTLALANLVNRYGIGGGAVDDMAVAYVKH